VGYSPIQVFVKGAKSAMKETEEMDLRVQKATWFAVKENQRILKLAIRRNLRGAPRWNQRGAWEKVPAVKLDGPTNAPRSGGPGKFTGALYRGVGGKKRPMIMPNGTVVGGVGIGGNINNLKKRPLEEKFPYFKPAVKATEPKMAQGYQKGWDKAVKKMGGII